LFAIKWLLPNLAEEPDAVQRFGREARAAGKIMHPNVVQVYDIGQEGAAHYILMELIHGVTLSERLRQRGRFEPVEACRVLIPVMRGLHAAHLAGVVHRDLKPQNIMLATNALPSAEVPKVLDFGISKILSHTGEHPASATRRGAIIGTPHYMPLEQLRSAQVDARTDVYALGVIAYHMLSGALPFASTNHADLVCQILGREARPLEQRVPELPRELVDVIAKAMAPDADDRFATMAALARALEPFAEGMTFAPAGEAEFTPVVRYQPPPDDPSHERAAAKRPAMFAEQTPLVAESKSRQLLRSSKSKRVQRALTVAAISVAAPALVVLGYNAAAQRRGTREALPVRAFTAPQAPVGDARPVADGLPPTRSAPAPAPALTHGAQHAHEATTRAPMTADWQAPAVAPVAAPNPPQATNGAGKAKRVSARTTTSSASRAVRAASPRRAEGVREQPVFREPAPLGTGTTPEIRAVDFH
jgi:serine/threonine-protein kinase